MALDIGSQVAGYRIDALIGRGGGGVVYRAMHRHLDRTCALKLLAPQLADDPDFRRRFEREAKMAAALDHPHIVPVYDAGEADGTLYLAMRLIDGPDLATVIKDANGRLDFRRTCAILRQVVSALDAAHAKGLVHRDVTPGNILIEHVGDADRTEHAYLSDFGLTRQYEGPALSRTMLAGTPSYMAHERIDGVPSAPAIDVYALGCVAYACLIGSPPFPGSSFESVRAAQLDRKPPRVSDHRADLPAGVDVILAKATAREPADRYPSCGAFVDALHEEVHATPVEPRTTWPPAPPSSGIEQPPAGPTIRTTRRRKIIGVATVAVLLISALVIFETLRRDPPLGGDSSPTEETANRLIQKVDAFAIDSAGGVYLSTLGKDHRILKVDPSGAINTIAGTGPKGYSGDNGPATQAQLWNPQGIALDGAGNLYVADTYNHRVRRIDPSGTITTIAGNGTQESTGDGGPAVSAQLRFPVDITIDNSDNLYVAEAEGRRVRRIDPNGRISTVAGTGVEGYSGDGGPATQAQLGFPLALAVDDSGNLYIADTANGRIRKVDAAGMITSIAGSGTEGFAGDGGPAAVAELTLPEGVAVDQSGSLYIADTGNDRIRKVDADGGISTVAGSGIRGFSGDGGLAATAQLAQPRGIAVDRDGSIYLGDQGSNRARKIDPNGVI
ncbi:MAG: protein kinase domain-containing protein, partial [Pseudonocardiaceae bacterium]